VHGPRCFRIRQRKTLREGQKAYKGGSSATRGGFSRPFVRCVCSSTKGSVGGIKYVAGAGVNVVESEQAGGTGILEVQTESLQRICDLHHGSFNEPKALRINPRRRLLNR
jgi:hypothetical protein